MKVVPEFIELNNHILLIDKTLYNLKSSGLRWNERLVYYLREMNFFYKTKLIHKLYRMDMFKNIFISMLVTSLCHKSTLNILSIL